MNAIQTAQKHDIRALIQSDKVKEQIALVLPKHLTPDRMARVALTAILKTPKLADCKPESLLQALMLCSQAGLEPDGRNAHLIPFGDQVQVIFDYKGLVALAERNGVENIYADKVCENDDFDAWVEEGEKKLRHRVNWKQPRGNAYAYYASCRRNGRLDYEVMTRDEVDSIRARSKAARSGPWVTDYDEMAKKTVLRRMSKRWDLSSEIAEAVYAEDDTPADIPQIKRPDFGGFGELPSPVQQQDKPTEKPSGKPKARLEGVTTPVPTTKPAPAQPSEAHQGTESPVEGNVEVPQGTEPAENAGSEPAGDDGGLGPQPPVEPFQPRTGENDALTNVRRLMHEDGVSEAQVCAHLKTIPGMLKEGQKLADLSTAKLLNVAKAWSNFLQHIRG